jgi:formylglycine-generating enzyme required for sulfatase activity
MVAVAWRACRIAALAGALLIAPSVRAGDEALPPGMVRVPAGAFTMGADAGQRAMVLSFGWSEAWSPRIQGLVAAASPPHTVHLDAFFIDRTEVTNDTYDAFRAATGQAPPAWAFDGPGRPVVGVSWYDAEAYCDWAGKRLPTEAEWEKAARGDDGRTYPWGNAWDGSRLRSADALAGTELADFGAWMDWRARRIDPFRPGSGPAPAGAHPDGASPYGALDMAGNVWEWTADWYSADTYTAKPRQNPKGPPTGTRRVLRGGGWDVPRGIAATWFREAFMASEEGRIVTGFRCAKDADGDDQVAERYLQ